MSPTRTVRFVLRSMQNQGRDLPCHSKAPILINGSEGWQAFSHLKKALLYFRVGYRIQVNFK